MTPFKLLQLCANIPEDLLHKEFVVRDLSPGERTFNVEEFLKPDPACSRALTLFVEEVTCDDTILTPAAISSRVTSMGVSDVGHKNVRHFLRDQIDKVVSWVRPDFAIVIMNRVAGTTSPDVDAFLADGVANVTSNYEDENLLLMKVYTELHASLAPYLR